MRIAVSQGPALAKERGSSMLARTPLSCCSGRIVHVATSGGRHGSRSGALRLGLRFRAGAGRVSVEEHHHGRSVAGRRHRRSALPLRRGEGDRVARPAGGGREPARRRRRPRWHGAGAAFAAGRLHAPVLDAAQLQHHASGVLESVVRPAAAGADQRARDLSADHHHAQGFAGEQSQGIHRLRQGQSRQGHLRPPGRGQHRSPARRADDAQGATSR